MNYLPVVLRGYFNKNTRNRLEVYFLREFKQAEENYFEADEFFDGCNNSLKELETKMIELMRGHESLLKLLSYQTEIGMAINLGNVTTGKKDSKEKIINDCQYMISNLALNYFPVDVQLSDGQPPVSVYYDDLLIIKQALFKAYDGIKSNNLGNRSPFSVLQWVAIFYYARDTKLLPKSRFLKTQMEQFMEKHQITNSAKYFKSMYYVACKRINKENNYPINKLKSIIPFIKENYPQAVDKIKNDIIFLEEKLTER